MKLRFLLPFALMALALAFVACDVEDDADADSTTTGEVTPTGCTADSDCADGQTCNVASGVCEGGGPTPLAYRFVRIDDLSPMSETEDGGADIDAIGVFDSAGTAHWASEVIAYTHGGGTSLEVNPEASLNAPDAFFEYPSVDNCRVDGGFVSLGGTGGSLIVRIGDDASFSGMMDGDTVEILEVGGCAFDGGTAIVEQVEVSVSVASDPTNPYWHLLGTGEGPEIVFNISNLPEVLP